MAAGGECLGDQAWKLRSPTVQAFTGFDVRPGALEQIPAPAIDHAWWWLIVVTAGSAAVMPPAIQALSHASQRRQEIGRAAEGGTTRHNRGHRGRQTTCSRYALVLAAADWRPVRHNSPHPGRHARAYGTAPPRRPVA